jgi:hypothetical protein
MAITKASASGLAGSKFKDASAGTTKIAALPDAPTIGTVTVSAVTATIPFTAARRGGTATTFTATSNPGNITASSATSPITISTLSNNTNYTFTVDSTTNPNFIFEIPDANIDSSTLQVTVQQNSTNSAYQVYNSTTDYLALGPTDLVYFLQEAVDGNDQIYILPTPSNQ